MALILHFGGSDISAEIRRTSSAFENRQTVRSHDGNIGQDYKPGIMDTSAGVNYQSGLESEDSDGFSGGTDFGRA